VMSLVAGWAYLNPGILGHEVTRLSQTLHISGVSQVIPVHIPIPMVPPPVGQIPSGSWPALSNADFFSKVHDELIAPHSDFLEADLSGMKLRLYRQGAVVTEVPILTKGRPGSWWETPAGFYKIQSKAQSAFSSFGHVYMPWSMAFQGNFLIH